MINNMFCINNYVLASSLDSLTKTALSNCPAPPHTDAPVRFIESQMENRARCISLNSFIIG